jgi:hypothetical protein
VIKLKYKMRGGFYESPIENRLVIEAIRKEEAEKLRKLLGEIRDVLKGQGIPVDQNCRVDMGAFKDVYKYGELENDLRRINRRIKEIKGDVEESLLTDGERLEVLKTIIFYKFLHEKFIIVRASFYDDVYNQVDNLIIEKETGNIVCAFDEVSTTSGPRLAKKQERFLRNRADGARVKYGVLSTRDGLTKREIENIPIFYLALPPEHINEGIRNLTSLEEISGYEKKLWAYFVTTLQSQIARLKLENLNEILRNRLLEFEKTLEELKTE